MTLRELKEARAKLVADMRALVELSERDGRNGLLTNEEDSQFSKMHEEQERITRQIERREAVENAEFDIQHATSLRGNPPALERSATVNPAEKKEKQSKAFEAWVRYGFDGMSVEQRSIMQGLRSHIPTSELPEEVRAQGVGSGAGGGFLVPQGFSEEFEKALKAFGGMRNVARLFPTPTGNDIPWPTVDDTANSGELLAENTPAALQDVVFGQVILKAYKYSSKIVLVSIELLQDSFFDIGTILRDLLAERIGRITNLHFTTGTGTGQPQGVVTASGQGKVGTTGQTTSVIADDLIDLEHSIDPLYRPNASYMFADSTLKVVKKLKDTTGRWLFQAQGDASIAASNTRPTVNGYPYEINQDVPAMAANAKSIVFGDFKRYVVRDIREFTLLRLEERYAEAGQVGFIAFTRSDGRAINAAALKHYANSAT